MAPKPRPAIERFMKLTERTENGCLLWTGYIQSNGYAKHWVDGKGVLAHRWSYQYHVGPIPCGLQIDHLCRVRNCVEPTHLEAVTPSENVRRSTVPEIARARGAEITHCPQGHLYDEENTLTGKNGRHCRTCKRQKAREYYERNRELVIQRAAEWRTANLERSRELSREGQRRYRAKKKAA